MKLVARFALALVVVAVLVAGGGAGLASANALPGDTLYGVKTTLQDLRLALTADAGARTQLEAQIQVQRMNEVRLALQHGRRGQVRFWGELTAFNDMEWTVGELTISLQEETRITGEPYLGAIVHVLGVVQEGGEIAALRLIVAPQRVATLLPTVAGTLTAMPTFGLPTGRPGDWPLPTGTFPPRPTRTPFQAAFPTQWPFPTEWPGGQPTGAPQRPTGRPAHDIPPRIATRVATLVATYAPTQIPPTEHWPTLVPTRRPTRTPSWSPTERPPTETWPTLIATHRPTTWPQPPNATPQPPRQRP
jgi:hypothetical protein